MKLSKSLFKSYIKSFSFTDLFNQLGWNYLLEELPLLINNHTYSLSTVAEKSGFRIMIVSADESGKIPSYQTRLKIDKQITPKFREHILIFTDSSHTRQLWQWILKEPGKPDRKCEISWNKNQDPELLYQRTSAILFTLDEEENITIVDVTKRVKENFEHHNEKVTKEFYKGFTNQHKLFLKFIEGINELKNKDWYASLMLNRLMFCYFIQNKGFLNNDNKYLRNKLELCKQNPEGNFYTFYRTFLLVLFHQGLGAPEHDMTFVKGMGSIPYLNGGLFEEHDLEKQFDINIKDEAFESLFDFFDKWNWCLDVRIQASGNDINPDVIGYIFEKYINERAKMGAYYTKEDITDYIGKNTIVPWLFGEIKNATPELFINTGYVWSFLKTNYFQYLNKYQLQGIAYIGEALPIKSEEYDLVAAQDYTLSGETWREVSARFDMISQLEDDFRLDKITTVDQLIAYNLNILQYVQDLLSSTPHPELIYYGYKALSALSVLDPTCGSGAFLFAALNILEPLYEVCLNRMQTFVDDALIIANNKTDKYLDFFNTILTDIDNPKHPNKGYYIYKSIILNNLYGVDIMKEAVEIAKLRLFLKLVATVEADYSKPNLGLEPLPDVDFNIRSGNTLIGFGTEKDFKNIAQWTFDFDKDEDLLVAKMKAVSTAFAKFKSSQTDMNGSVDIKASKSELNTHLKELNFELNIYLAKQYGIPNLDKIRDLGISAFNRENDNWQPFTNWLSDYQPFHWFAEFYDIIHDHGGFDIVIGNPPYLELKDINYEPKHLKTKATKAVHNMCIERSLQILNDKGSIAMIVPLALVCTQRMVTVQQMLESNRNVFYSNFSWRPGKLFDEVNRALTIFVANSSEQKAIYTTRYAKWYSDNRESLFPQINYLKYPDARNSFWVPKINHNIELAILHKILKSSGSFLQIITKSSSNRIYYRTTGGLYWKIFTIEPPKFFSKGQASSSSRETSFPVINKKSQLVGIALLSSNIFWWWYTITSNLRDLNPSDIQGFRFPTTVLEDNEIEFLAEQYLADLEKNSVMLTRQQKQTGETQTQSFKISTSKPIIDEIDKNLAKHYGFTDEEIDYITHYDIKYRLGKGAEDEESEEFAAKEIQKALANVDNNSVVSTHESPSMKEFSLDEGIYAIRDVVQITKLSYEKVNRWFKELSEQHYEGLSAPQRNDVDKIRISFHGLIELVVIDTLRDNGFSLNKILLARADLKTKTGKLYPFATNNVKDNLKIAGKSLIFRFASGDITLDGSGQFNLKIIEDFFRNMEFDDQGIALRLFPVMDSKLIIIDPSQGGGKAVINGKGVWADAIASVYDGPESMQMIKEQYEVDENEIMAAVGYCN
ncbi:MAG: hypothetical protein NVSMB24_38680 [Mucilaginibacter sp.]